MLLGQGPHKARPLRRLWSAVRGEEHRRRGAGVALRGAGLVCDWGGQARRDPHRHLRHRQGGRQRDRHRSRQAVRPEPARHHQRAEPQAAAFPPDSCVRPLRAHGHRRTVGVDRARQGARTRARRAHRLTRTFAVIPAGGMGTRLWPRSRASTPKHVLPLGEHGRPLLRATYDRAKSLADEGFVLPELGQQPIIEAVLPEVDTEHLILEPQARGTTNAYGLAALTLMARDPSAVTLALPAARFASGGASRSRTSRARGSTCARAATTGTSPGSAGVSKSSSRSWPNMLRVIWRACAKSLLPVRPVTRRVRRACTAGCRWRWWTAA